MKAREIILRPLITEKTTLVREADGTYCFKVAIRANKLEIARAVEQLFRKEKVKVASVHTARVSGKVKRMGRTVGRRPDWKKAWVTLTPDSGQIEFFEAT